MKKLFVVLIVLLLVGCRVDPAGIVVVTLSAPVVTVVTAITPPTEFLNDNPDLEFGACGEVMFETADFGWEFISQCLPFGYELHENVDIHPISINFTGVAYSILPNGGGGEIGLISPKMALVAGIENIIKTYGDLHFWGCDGNCAMRAYYLYGDDEAVDIGGTPLPYNGGYRTMFSFVPPESGDYRIGIYLLIVHPVMTADSYLTIERITVE